MKSRTVLKIDNQVPDVAEDSLAATLQKSIQESGKSIYQISNTSGVDATYIWRLMRGEKRNVSREVLVRLSVALADSECATRTKDIANDLLDAAGFKRLD